MLEVTEMARKLMSVILSSAYFCADHTSPKEPSPLPLLINNLLLSCMLLVRLALENSWCSSLCARYCAGI